MVHEQLEVRFGGGQSRWITGNYQQPRANRPSRDSRSEIHRRNDATVKLPVEAWLTKGSYVWDAPAEKKISAVTIDPRHVLPDDDRSNNEKKAEQAIH